MNALVVTCLALVSVGQADPISPTVPGIVIVHRPAATREYVGSPGLVVLEDGTYLAKCDLFGPGGKARDTVALVFRSADRGRSWTPVGEVDRSFWSTIFLHRGAVYLFGTAGEYGPLTIRRSDDGGVTWTSPDGPTTGLLSDADAPYHTAPTPFLAHDGRLWRAVEDASDGTAWGTRFMAQMASIPAEADPLDREAWTFSNPIARDAGWLPGGDFTGWLEGNAVLTPEGRIVDVLRVEAADGSEGRAAIAEVSADGRTLTFDPATGLIDFPGGTKKFTIRHDGRSGRYWSLVNWIPPAMAGRDRAGKTRNTLALVCSTDLRTWTVRSVVLFHPDVARHGFQYPEWLFDGDDLIATVRTAYDDGAGGAHNAHDANYLTFHRITGFRDRTLADSCVPVATLGVAETTEVVYRRADAPAAAR